ncbi:MAG: glycosyltransferase family 2 protein [Verrucomicrobiota bacterium]
MSNEGKSPFLVTVYVTSHNYGRFLREALDSVLKQTLDSWELIVLDDGSSDDSAEIAEEYAKADPDRILVIATKESRGLRACANEAIEKARGRYIMRLDADDFLDENALLVLSHYLERHPEVGLVFPNWVYIDEGGRFLGIERRKLIGEESKVLDLPAHGACTMVRRRILKSVGGYDVNHDSQDGHELWLKVLDRHEVANVETPLFYYRQHGSSMSRNEERLLAARRTIKRSLASRESGEVSPRIVAVIPARNTYKEMPNVVFSYLGGKTLLDHTLDETRTTGVFDTIYVSTDDAAVVEYCRNQEGVLSDLRDPKLSDSHVRLSELAVAAVERLESVHSVFPDIVVVLSVHSPFRRAAHIQEAVDTLKLYRVDNVFSAYEDFDLHFQHGENGMSPLNPGMIDRLRYEREALFVDNGALHASWRDFLREDNLYEGRIGHIIMTRQESLQIKSQKDLEYANWLLSNEHLVSSMSHEK